MANTDYSTENLKKIVLWLTPGEIAVLVELLKDHGHPAMADYVAVCGGRTLMPAFFGDVAITFHREGKPDDRRIAADGLEAVFIALSILAALDELGDKLVVTAGAEDLPAVSRSSHYS